MGTVRKSSYRLPPTPKGIEAIEQGDLDYFDPLIWDNLNTGLLEEYLEEKNRRESFDRSTFDWMKVGLGIFIGTLFAIITQYVGLKVGIAVSGSWYVAYLIGIAGKGQMVVAQQRAFELLPDQLIHRIHETERQHDD